MEVVPVGVPLSFEVTFDDPSLFVAMRVFDNTGGTPVQVGSPIPMSAFYGNSYQAEFTPSEGVPYLLHKAVYTDGDYDTLSPDYAAGTESIIAVDFGGGGGGSDHYLGDFVEGTVEPVADIE